LVVVLEVKVLAAKVATQVLTSLDSSPSTEVEREREVVMLLPDHQSSLLLRHLYQLHQAQRLRLRQLMLLVLRTRAVSGQAERKRLRRSLPVDRGFALTTCVL